MMNAPKPPCRGLTDIFFGNAYDLRDEVGKFNRETLAKEICSTCAYQVSCLDYCFSNYEDYGVWGNFTPGERREFKEWLYKQGYKSVPHNKELMQAVEFYRGASITTYVPKINRRKKKSA